MIDRHIRPAQEQKIHSAILRVVGERGLGRRPIDEVTTADVAAMAHAAYRTLPEARPVSRTMGTRPPADPPERSATVTPDRIAPEKAPTRPLTAPSPDPAGNEDSAPPSAPLSTLQRLRSEPTPCAILTLVGEGHSDRVIAKQLNLTHNYVVGQVRRWIRATGSMRRGDLATWARRNATTVGPEAQR